jgi:hypothetical protein
VNRRKTYTDFQDRERQIKWVAAIKDESLLVLSTAQINEKVSARNILKLNICWRKEFGLAAYQQLICQVGILKIYGQLRRADFDFFRSGFC